MNTVERPHTGPCAECEKNGITEPPTYPPLTFTLTIELGNEGMQTTGDVQSALADGFARALLSSPSSVLSALDGTSIRDVNGNKVGSWGVK